MPAECLKCGTSNPWPAELPRDALRVCYECIQSGRVAIGHETPLGNVDYTDSLRGMLWLGNKDQAKKEGLQTTVMKKDGRLRFGNRWIGVHLPVELLSEMHRTPRYLRLQREYWPFHCAGFMAYLGRWQQEDFERVSNGRGLSWFLEHFAGGHGKNAWEWLPSGIGWSHVHKCLQCGLHRVFVDSD